MDINNKYVVRLRQEWEQHGKIIIAVDFDDTISPWKFNKEELQNTINVLKEAKQTGAYIVIFTACESSRFDEIKTYCNTIGLQIDTINENPFSMPYGNNGKVYANIFIDDRAGLEEAIDILSTCTYLQRSFKNSQKQYDEIG